MYHEGDLSYFEAINKETIRNALNRLLDMGLILIYKGTVPPLLMKAKQTGSIQSWISVHPDWIPQSALPSFIDLNASQSTKADISSFMDVRAPGLEDEKEDTLSVWYFHRPAGRLWDFCEKIGKFRREGKNRRDSQTVASRVLRLARLSRLWIFDINGKRKLENKM